MVNDLANINIGNMLWAKKLLPKDYQKTAIRIYVSYKFIKDIAFYI